MTATKDVSDSKEMADSGRAVLGTTRDKGSAKALGKKPSTKRLVLLGVVVVLVAIGLGFGVWHEKPSFCNAICHSPMDNYVEGYYSSETLMVAKHGQADVSCLDCHKPVLSEQFTEGIAWLKHNFSVDEEGFIIGADAAKTVGTRDSCYKCHNDGDASTGEDWPDIQAATADLNGHEGANPHKSHNGDQECSDCHMSHRNSALACDKCHGFEPPDGWVKPKLF
ncbi:MAG: cytochrome c3 family protein [Coriobacteriia bacterium]